MSITEIHALMPVKIHIGSLLGEPMRNYEKHQMPEVSTLHKLFLQTAREETSYRVLRI